MDSNPLFLKERESVWPTTDKTIPLPDDSNEKRKIVLTMAIEPAIDIDRFTNFMRLNRTLGWMLRFIGIIRNFGKPKFVCPCSYNY